MNGMDVLDNSIKSICNNCLHAFGCSHKNGTSQIVNLCEEHESDSFTAIHKRIDESVSQLTFKGLCSNCDNQNSCTLKNKGNIIFSCEEYK